MGTGIRTEKGSSFPPKMISRKVLFSLGRSEEHTSELQSRLHLVCRLLLEKKKKDILKSVAETGMYSVALGEQRGVQWMRIVDRSRMMERVGRDTYADPLCWCCLQSSCPLV